MSTPQLHRFTADAPAGFLINAPAGETYDERVLVFVNGIKWAPGADSYTRTSTSIEFNCDFLEDDVIEINPVGGTTTISGGGGGDTIVTVNSEELDVTIQDAPTTVSVNTDVSTISVNTDTSNINVNSNTEDTITVSPEITNLNINTDTTTVTTNVGNPQSITITGGEQSGHTIQALGVSTIGVDDLPQRDNLRFTGFRPDISDNASEDATILNFRRNPAASFTFNWSTDTSILPGEANFNPTTNTLIFDGPDTTGAIISSTDIFPGDSIAIVAGTSEIFLGTVTSSTVIGGGDISVVSMESLDGFDASALSDGDQLLFTITTQRPQRQITGDTNTITIPGAGTNGADLTFSGGNGGTGSIEIPQYIYHFDLDLPELPTNGVALTALDNDWVENITRSLPAAIVGVNANIATNWNTVIDNGVQDRSGFSIGEPDEFRLSRTSSTFQTANLISDGDPWLDASSLGFGNAFSNDRPPTLPSSIQEGDLFVFANASLSNWAVYAVSSTTGGATVQINFIASATGGTYEEPLSLYYNRQSDGTSIDQNLGVTFGEAQIEHAEWYSVRFNNRVAGQADTIGDWIGPHTAIQLAEEIGATATIQAINADTSGLRISRDHIPREATEIIPMIEEFDTDTFSAFSLLTGTFVSFRGKVYVYKGVNINVSAFSASLIISQFNAFSTTVQRGGTGTIYDITALGSNFSLLSIPTTVDAVGEAETTVDGQFLNNIGEFSIPNQIQSEGATPAIIQAAGNNVQLRAADEIQVFADINSDNTGSNGAGPHQSTFDNNGRLVLANSTRENDPDRIAVSKDFVTAIEDALAAATDFDDFKTRVASLNRS